MTKDLCLICGKPLYRGFAYCSKLCAGRGKRRQLNSIEESLLALIETFPDEWLCLRDIKIEVSNPKAKLLAVKKLEELEFCKLYWLNKLLYIANVDCITPPPLARYEYKCDNCGVTILAKAKKRGVLQFCGQSCANTHQNKDYRKELEAKVLKAMRRGQWYKGTSFDFFEYKAIRLKTLKRLVEQGLLEVNYNRTEYRKR